MTFDFVESPMKRSHYTLAFILTATLAACTEPRTVERPKVAPAPALEARLELSDSTARAGEQIRVVVRLTGTKSIDVASITARIAYDSTAFRFVGEDTLSDGATRVVNPASGVIRFAAIAPKGFTNGQLYVMRFAVLRASPVESLRLTVDELHTAAQTDVMSSLTSAKP
jgi:hypothetical protein